ncbi:MAG: hypothetical protein A2X36_04370 [Elusimicrobia bacterium GWA2_69_24]|nr:MAG: hypothetical protein A2X36_04370 [Elusimicrobia bacterium GWA2_69_24]
MPQDPNDRIEADLQGNSVRFDYGEPEGPITVARPLSDRRSLLLSLGGLVALILFHFWSLGSWIRKDARPPSWDQAAQMEAAWDYHGPVAAGDWDKAIHLSPKTGSFPLPPLYAFSIQGAMDKPDPAKAVLWINGFYMALLCLSLWGLGKHFMGPLEGLGAAVLFSCIPEVQWLLREPLVDLALTAWVVAAYWALAASDNLQRKVPALLFGVLFSAAMLTKWSAPSYFMPFLGICTLAWKTRRGKLGLLLAVGTAAALSIPWYWIQWPVLVTRLFQAAANHAVPSWRIESLFTYVMQMAAGLEFPFFVLGLISLAVPSVRRKRDSWLLLFWFAASFLFWTIVPDRQLRYLLPGLAPLALFAMGPWPKALTITLCSFGFLSACNYGLGWISEKKVDVGIPVVFFRSDPPKTEDWKVGEILQEASRRHDPDAPFGNLTVAADHALFNGATFDWERRRRRIENLRNRGVDRRFCEFSEFVVVKSGTLGPVTAAKTLTADQEAMLEAGSWFQRGYLQVGRWDLPDKTEALLFQRRRSARPPVQDRELRFNYFEEEMFLAEDLNIDFGAWDAARGVYPKVTVKATRLVLLGLEILGPRVEMEGLSLVPVFESNSVAKPLGGRESPVDVRILKMSRLRILSATVTEGAFETFLKARVSQLSSPKVGFDKTVRVEGRSRGMRVALEVLTTLRPDGSGLDATLRSLSLGAFAFPVSLLGPQARYALDFAPGPVFPFRLDIPSLSLSGSRLRIGAPAL